MVPMKNRLASEFLGTFALVMAGTGAVVVNAARNGAIGHVGIALTFGLVIMAMVFALGDVSGAHLNPAVTLGLTVAGRAPAAELVPYWIAQIAGAFAASGLLRLLFPALPAALGTTLPSGTPVESLVFEIILTFFLVLVVLQVTTGAKEKGITAAVAVGGTITLCALFGGPISGASMNPARSLAPAVVSMNLQHLWVYMAGPLAGAVLAVGATWAVRGTTK